MAMVTICTMLSHVGLTIASEQFGVRWLLDRAQRPV
jgi:hypothetical protein